MASLKLDDITVDWAKSPRRNFSIPMLKTSMETHGLLKPISVSVQDGEIVLTHGYLRFASAQELGWDEIPVVLL